MDYFAKKQWIRIAVCAVLVAVGVLAMTGMFSGNQPLMYDSASVNGSTVVSAEATEQGFGGDVTVNATVADGAITELTIDTPNETEGLGKRASDAEFTEQFIGKTGPFTFGEDGIEALSGATVTSNAALKAINRIVSGEDAVPAEDAEPEAEEKPAEEPKAEPEEKTEEKPAEEKPADERQEDPAAETDTEQKTETAEAAAGGQSFGVYRSTKENTFSKITVVAAAKNGKLTDVQITSEGEEGKDLLTDAIRDEWAKAILESGSAAPDAVTGATLTFSAGSVQEAMTEILAEMNGEAAETEAAQAEEKTEEKQEESAPETEEKPAETKTEEPAASNGQSYGVYRSTKENTFSKVTVTAAAKNGKLTDVQITSEGEEGKDLLTDEIRGDWAKAILESGSATPDAITGATLTFSAGSVQEAVTEILAEMNGETAEATVSEPEAEEATAETTEESTAETAAEPAEEPEPEATGAPEAGEPAKTPPAYAGYRVEKENQFSRITVIACAKNGKLVSVRILSEGEEGKDLLTDAIRDEWAKAILESGSAETDAITGATLAFSAGSVQEAMEEILAKAAGN